MKMAYTPRNVSAKCHLPSVSFIMRPYILGNQKYVPAKMPNIAATPITKWKCATTKYVACSTESMDGCARKKPLIPPEMNTDTKPRQKSIDVVNRIFDP